MSKKKILLLSDALRMSSGIGTMSKEFVLGTVQHYDWIQIGGAIKHPEAGKVVDMNESVRKTTGVEDATLKIYQSNLTFLTCRDNLTFFLTHFQWFL